MMQIQKTNPLYLQVYTILKTELLDGNYKPGEKLVESRLAEKFGVSRGPIREAMGRLEQEGLLTQKGNYTYVIEYTKKDVIDVYQCRKALESLAAELAAKYITEDQLKQLEEALKRSEESLKLGFSKDVVQYNTLFHDTIIAASNNESLIYILKGLSGKILYFRNTIIGHYHRNADYIKEHHKIYGAISKGDPILAKTYMEEHIDSDISAFIGLMDNKVEYMES